MSLPLIFTILLLLFLLFTIFCLWKWINGDRAGLASAYWRFISFVGGLFIADFFFPDFHSTPRLSTLASLIWFFASCSNVAFNLGYPTDQQPLDTLNQVRRLIVCLLGEWGLLLLLSLTAVVAAVPRCHSTAGASRGVPRTRHPPRIAHARVGYRSLLPTRGYTLKCLLVQICCRNYPWIFFILIIMESVCNMSLQVPLLPFIAIQLSSGWVYCRFTSFPSRLFTAWKIWSWCLMVKHLWIITDTKFENTLIPLRDIILIVRSLIVVFFCISSTFSE